MRDKTQPAAAWLAVAATAMTFMGAYAFLIALSRAPVFNTLFPSQDFFRVALITHVTLSLVIWFVAFTLFTAHYVTRDEPWTRGELIPAAGAMLGVALIIITPFTGPAHPVLNNYVPVLDRGLYFTALGIFFAFSTLGFVWRIPALIRVATRSKAYPVIIPGVLLAAAAGLVSGDLCVLLSLRELSQIPEVAGDAIFYEALFWGGGHVMQFANTLCVMAVWALLSLRLPGGRAADGPAAWLIIAVMTAPVLFAPFIYFQFPALSPENRQVFLELKRWGLAAGPIFAGAWALYSLKGGGGGPVRRGLALSLFLFALGGLISLTIHGSDTRVPAHYHGVIGAVTLANMTLALAVTRDAGWLKVREGWMTMQATMYGVGQSLFAIGLFIGGLAGLPRKTFGAAQELDTALKYTGMGVMGIGGLMAVLGGAAFVVFMIRAFWPERGARP